jgi:hypothetical protein
MEDTTGDRHRHDVWDAQSTYLQLTTRQDGCSRYSIGLYSVNYQVTVNEMCLSCLLGQWSPEGSDNCVVCPDNSVAPGPVGTDRIQDCDLSVMVNILTRVVVPVKVVPSIFWLSWVTDSTSSNTQIRDGLKKKYSVDHVGVTWCFFFTTKSVFCWCVTDTDGTSMTDSIVVHVLVSTGDPLQFALFLYPSMISRGSWEGVLNGKEFHACLRVNWLIQTDVWI